MSLSIKPLLGLCDGPNTPYQEIRRISTIRKQIRPRLIEEGSHVDKISQKDISTVPPISKIPENADEVASPLCKYLQCSCPLSEHTHQNQPSY